MARSRRILFLMVGALVSTSVLGQSLGEIAEREKKKAPPRSGRVYTDDDLRQARTRGTLSAPGAVADESGQPGEAAGDARAAAARLRDWMGRTLRVSSEREAAHAALQAVVDSNVLFGQRKGQIEGMLGASTPCRLLLAGQGMRDSDACYQVGRLPDGVAGSPEFLVVGFGADGLSDKVEVFQAR